MPTPNLPPEVRAAIETLASHDPEIQAMLRDLIALALRTYVDALTNGKHSDRLRAAQMLTGPLFATLSPTARDDGLDQIKADIAELRDQAVRDWRGHDTG